MAWVLDRAHVSIEFAVRELIVATVHGRFTDFNAEVSLDLKHPERSRVTADVGAASLDTGNPIRDAHLRSGDFLDVEHYPRITFVSQRATQIAPDTFWLRGDLTIHGVMREVTFSGKLETPVAQIAAEHTVGFLITTEIDRDDYGMDWNVPLDSGGVVVGHLVAITIDAHVIEVPQDGSLPNASSATPNQRAEPGEPQ
jgi:polyisoprenoid-binding protein YceI